MKCKHRKTWLIANGYWEWCYQCGAIRPMKRIKGIPNGVAPNGRWTCPTGQGGVNPALTEALKFSQKIS